MKKATKVTFYLILLLGLIFFSKEKLLGSYHSDIYALDGGPSITEEPTHEVTPTLTPTPSPFPIIVWDKNRPLTWDDFKGPVPSPKPEGIDAESVTGVNSKYKITSKCEPIGKSGKVKCTATAEDIKATAEFDPNTSWVDPDKKTDKLLKHEQGHFDISEYFARKKQKEMEKAAKNGVTKEGPSDKAADLMKEAEDELDHTLMKICDDINAEEDKMQKQYDSETDHGKNDKEQEKWNKKIENLLK